MGFSCHPCQVDQLGADSAYARREEQYAGAMVRDAGEVSYARRHWEMERLTNKQNSNCSQNL